MKWLNCPRNLRGAFVLALSLVLLPPALAEPASVARNSLWQVQGTGASVYLLGSIHFLKREFYPLADPIEQAYADSGVVVFETDIDNMMNPGSLMKLATAGMYPPGQKLSQNVSKETYAALEKQVKDGLGSAAALDTLRPWMVAVTLLGLELQKMGFDPKDGVDQYFNGKARKDGKEIGALETVDDQIGLFAGLTKEEDEAFLKTTLEELDKAPEMITEMVEGWRTGDTQVLDQLLNDLSRESPEFHKKFVTDRNRKWLSKIESRLNRGQHTLVVVGAGHLVGPDSVVDLLQKKGYKVEQK